jgi:type I restriction enzyme R subunit
MMCVSSVDVLTQYYEQFKARQHPLKIATIFSYSANENDKDANGYDQLDESDGASVDETHINQHSRDKLEGYIGDYNATFGTNFTTKDSQSFYNYYNDISKRVKQAEVDILLVVNMFLTGFDSKTLNTLYVDKNLKYHGLIQAFSRTNRILNEQKSQGNIVCFRNLKTATDDAIALFSDKDAKEIILMKPYEEYVAMFIKALEALKAIAPSVDSVNGLVDEEEKLAFVKAFRELMRLKNILGSFADFSFDDVAMPEQEFEDYKSKYLDIHDSIGKSEGKEKVSILEDVDFELELIHKDEINVSYILKLLAKLQAAEGQEKAKQRQTIINIINGNAQLRSKRELIEKFIDSTLASIEDTDAVDDAFESFWEGEKVSAFERLCDEENLIPEQTQQVIETYLYEQRTPLKDAIASTLKVKPKLLERKTIVPKVLDKIMGFVERFYDL